MPFEALVIDAEVQPRVDGLHKPTVADYRERYKDNDTFEPLVAYGTKKRAWLSEGFHRAEVYRLEKVETVEVELRDGTREDAIVNADSSNARHGLKRTAADKRRSIERVVRMRPQWSDRKVGDHCVVDHKTVGTVRREMTQVGNSPPSHNSETVDAMPVMKFPVSENVETEQSGEPEPEVGNSPPNVTVPANEPTSEAEQNSIDCQRWIEHIRMAKPILAPLVNQPDIDAAFALLEDALRQRYEIEG